MAAQRQTLRMSVVEYLEFERTAESRHEYYDGVIFDMAGASINHNRITIAAASSLINALRGKDCEVFMTDLRLRISLSRYAYPDVIVVGGDVVTTDEEPPAVLNPVLIVEVLSPSTEAFDRDSKFDFYASIPSFQEYLLISQTQPRVEQRVRSGPQWDLNVHHGPDAIVQLKSISVDLRLSELYARVEFGTEGAA